MTDKATTVPPARSHAPIDPANAYVLVVEDNIQNFVLIARLMAFLGVKQCQCESLWLAGAGICRQHAARRFDFDGHPLAL